MHEEVAKLVESGRLNQKAGEQLSKLAPGAFCSHRSWGVGKIASWDLLGDSIIIDFEEKPGHVMKLAFAAKSLQVLEPDHILAQRVANPDEIKALARDEPVELIRRILKSYDSEMMLDQLDGVLRGTVIEEAKYKSWWEATKKKLKETSAFVVPPKRNLPLQLRPDDVDPREAMTDELTVARDYKSKSQLIQSLIKEAEELKNREDLLDKATGNVTELAESLKKLQPGSALELLVMRDQLLEACEKKPCDTQVAELLAAHASNVAPLINALPASAQKYVYKVIPSAFGDEWPKRMLELLNEVNLRGVSEIARFFESSGRVDEFNEHLRTGVQQRTLASDVLAWVCKERTRLAESVFVKDIGAALVNAMERDHYGEERGRNRLAELLSSDSTLIADMLEGQRPSQIKNLARRLYNTPALDQLTRGSLLARIIKIHPDVQQLVDGGGDEPEEDQHLIVSWESLERRQAELEEIRTKKIPANTEEIKLARSYGDLRENAEYKAAKEMQRVLQKQESDLDADIERARGTDFKGVDTSKVSIGTVVSFKDVASDAEETYTVLGAWDTDLEKNVISYMSAVGQALLEHKIGEKFSIPSEDGEKTVELTGIKCYAE